MLICRVLIRNSDSIEPCAHSTSRTGGRPQVQGELRLPLTCTYHGCPHVFWSFCPQGLHAGGSTKDGSEEHNSRKRLAHISHSCRPYSNERAVFHSCLFLGLFRNWRNIAIALIYQRARISFGRGALNSKTEHRGVLSWLAPRFYRGKSGLHGLFTSSASRSEDGSIVSSDSGLYRAAKAGRRSRALLRGSTWTCPILERKSFIPT
jgi:hypothetical protein